MNINFKSALSVLLVASMLVAALTGGALANPAVTADSDISSDDALNLDPSSSDVAQLEFDTPNTNTSSMTVTVVDNSTGTTEAQLTDADADLTNNSGTWVGNFSHSELANTTEHSVGETYELKVTIEHVHDSDSDGVTTTNTTTKYVDAMIVATPNEETVLVSSVTEGDLGVDVGVEAASGGFFGFGAEDYDTFTVSGNHPHGDAGYNNTTYVLQGDSASAFDAAANNASSGDPLVGMSVFVAGDVVPVYSEEAGDLHEDNSSYAVYDSSTDEITVEFGEERSDAFATDVRVTNNDVLEETGFSTVSDIWGITTAIDLLVGF